MSKLSLRSAAYLGLFSALLTAACTVSSGDDDDDSGGASSGGTSSSKGGSSGKGGTSASGGSSAGAGATSAGGDGAGGDPTGSGGATGGTGGSDMTATCDPDTVGGAGGFDHVGEPGDCEPSDAGDSCQECIQESCCDLRAACSGYEPYNVCGWGGPDEWPMQGGEFGCYIDCMQQEYIDRGGYEDESRGVCAGECVTTEATNGACGVIGTTTSELAQCVHDSCQAACIGE